MTWNSSRDGPAPPARLRIWADDGWLAVAAPLLIFAGHALYGAMLPQTALALTAIFALLAGACLWRPKLRKDLLRLDGLALPAIMFGLVILVALWSLTPFVPGGAHPVWAYLKISPGAATVDKSATLLEIIKLLGLGCVFVAGAAVGGSDSRARLSTNTLLVLGVAIAAWAFLNFVTGADANPSHRLEANFQSANAAATLFAVLLVLTAGPVVSRLSAGDRGGGLGALLFGAAGLLFLACLFMTASRGALAGAAAGLLGFIGLLVFRGRLKFSRALSLGIGGAVLGFILLAAGGELLLSRLLGTTGDFGARAVIAKVHWQAFLTSPLLGFGLGTFDVVNRTLLDPATFPQLWMVRAAHNIYLGWLEEGGLLGAVPMFACVALIMATALRKGFRRSRMTPIVFALVAADLVYLVHGATDFALQMFSISAMWAYLLGLQFSLSQGSSAR